MIEVILTDVCLFSNLLAKIEAIVGTWREEAPSAAPYQHIALDVPTEAYTSVRVT